MTFHRYLFVGLLFCIVLIGCGPGAEVGYSPPFIPIRISADTQGTIKASFDKQVRTPIGTFDLGVDATLAELAQHKQTILIVQVDQTVSIYPLETGKSFHVEFVGENQLYRKVRLEYQQNGNILLELESLANAPVARYDQAEAVTVAIYANQEWQSTELTAQVGETVTITSVSGRWSPWPHLFLDGRGCLEDPSICSPDPDHPSNVVHFKHGGLVGRIGDQAFAVGNATEFIAATQGTIFLRINDRYLGDNSGALTVKIAVTR